MQLCHGVRTAQVCVDPHPGRFREKFNVSTVFTMQHDDRQKSSLCKLASPCNLPTSAIEGNVIEHAAALGSDRATSQRAAIKSMRR
jgi:hypothetical protein